MRLNHRELAKYIDKLALDLRGEVLGVPALFNKMTLWFPLMDSGKDLVVSLRNGKPMVALTHFDQHIKPFTSDVLNSFRDNLDYFKIQNMYLKDNDYILGMDIVTISDVPFTIIIELFSKRANIYLLDKSNGLLASFLPVEVETYSFPIQENFVGEGSENIKDYIKDRIQEEINLRISEKYGYFFDYINLQIKKNQRATAKENYDINALLDESKQIIEQNIALLSSGYTLSGHYDEVEIYTGEKIRVDKSMSLKEFAEKNIKEAQKLNRKAKTQIENTNRLKAELRFYTSLLEKFDRCASDETRDKVILESGLFKTGRNTKESPFNVPYKINHNGLIVYFGKNAKQNDYLSFTKTLNREFVWFHVKDYTGAHVVLAKVKPNEKEIILAASIALVASKLTTGLVSYTIKKNIRKGKHVGEAILKNYTTIKINNIEKYVYDLVENAVKDTK